MWQIETASAASSGEPFSRHRPHAEAPKTREISRKMSLESRENPVQLVDFSLIR
jgi:hypothetical protein